MTDNNKEYIEPEIIKKGEEKRKNFSGNKIDLNDQLETMKDAILLEGLTRLILPVTVFILVLAGIIILIMWVFAYPFDYIFSGLILFFLFKAVYKFIKIFIK